MTENIQNSPQYVKICMEPNFAVQNFKKYVRYNHNSFSRVEIHVRWILISNGLVISYVDPEGGGKPFFPPGGRSWNNQVHFLFGKLFCECVNEKILGKVVRIFLGGTNLERFSE